MTCTVPLDPGRHRHGGRQVVSDVLSPDPLLGQPAGEGGSHRLRRPTDLPSGTFLPVIASKARYRAPMNDYRNCGGCDFQSRQESIAFRR